MRTRQSKLKNLTRVPEFFFFKFLPSSRCLGRTSECDSQIFCLPRGPLWWYDGDFSSTPAECPCVSLLSVPVCAPSRLLQRPVWFDNNISCELSGQQKHSSLSRLSLRSVSRLRRNIHISNYGCYPLTRHGFRLVFRVEILCLSRMERGECQSRQCHRFPI